MSLLIATTNPGKLREILPVLAGTGRRLLTLRDVAPVPEPEETGRTFAENAALKARAYAGATRLPTVAEDSGLVIDALGGRPGVESARYPGATYDEKFANLYRELAPHPRPWTARFVCAIACVDGSRRSDGAPLELVFTGEAMVDGHISDYPAGSEGFGYDPIFFYAPYGKTLGQVTGADKLAVSHRGQAFRIFRHWLTETAKTTVR